MFPFLSFSLVFMSRDPIDNRASALKGYPVEILFINVILNCVLLLMSLCCLFSFRKNLNMSALPVQDT